MKNLLRSICSTLLVAALVQAEPAPRYPDTADFDFKVTDKTCKTIQKGQFRRHSAKARLVLTNKTDHRLLGFSGILCVLSEEQKNKLKPTAPFTLDNCGMTPYDFPAVEAGKSAVVPVEIDLDSTATQEVLQGQFWIQFSVTPISPKAKARLEAEALKHN